MGQSEGDWNGQMGCTWGEAEAWAATPRRTVEEAMADWMVAQKDQREAER